MRVSRRFRIGKIKGNKELWCADPICRFDPDAMIGQRLDNHFARQQDVQKRIVKEQTVLVELQGDVGQREIQPEQLLHDDAALDVVADVRIENVKRIVDDFQMRQVLVVELDIDRIAAGFKNKLEVLEAIVRSPE